MWDRCIEWNGNLELLKSLRKLNENLGRYLRAVSWNVVSNHFPGAKGGWGNWRAMPTFWLLPTLNNVSHFMFSIIHTSQSFKYMYIHPHNTRHNWQYMFNLTWAMLYLSYLIPTPGHRITWGCWCRICASLQRAVANLGLCTWDTGPSKHNGFLAAFCCRFFSRWMRLKGLEGEVIQVIYVCIYNLFIYIYDMILSNMLVDVRACIALRCRFVSRSWKSQTFQNTAELNGRFGRSWMCPKMAFCCFGLVMFPFLTIPRHIFPDVCVVPSPGLLCVVDQCQCQCGWTPMACCWFPWWPLLAPWLWATIPEN